jgi:hypothetical protein
MLSTIGWYAVIQVLISLPVVSPLRDAADQSFRKSSRHQTINDCAAFDTKGSCLGGAGECIWHPKDGCISAKTMAHMSDRISQIGEEEENKGDDEARLKVSRVLQTTRKPSTRKPTSPTNSPTRIPTRRPTNSPTTRSPTSRPTSRSPVSHFFCTSFFSFFRLLSMHRPETCSTTDP